MNENEVLLRVEEAIQNNKLDLFFFENNFESAREEYIWNTAKRLVNVWKLCQNNVNIKVDFECALRNFLLLVKRELRIPKYIPSNRFTDFGLNIEEESGRIWVTLNLPDFTNNVLVKQLYMQDLEEGKVDREHNLSTNEYIKSLTGFDCFKSDEQKLSVIGSLRVPDGYSCLVSMTTGGGKSLITQTVAYQSVGLTIVIVPTISLMLDQYSNAKKIINSEVEGEIFFYHSESSLDEFVISLNNKRAKLLFVSPESLITNQVLRAALLKANGEKYLRNIIVDEAHIVVEWGSSFRIDFQCLDAFRKMLMRENEAIRTYLLSATYSDETIRQLKLFYGGNDKWIEIRCEKLRHETRFDIIKCDSYSEKRSRILTAIDLLPHPMIVYVQSPDEAEHLKEILFDRGYNNVNTFTGKTANSNRLQIINQWKSGEFDLMIATCAFGVGVDKKDVRTVLHTYVPENPNKYYQEAGRGGRDSLPCLSTMIYIEKDIDSAFAFLNKVITTEKLIGRWFSMLKSNRTIPLHDSKYLVDTYVKPNYNTDEEYFDSISNQDINWNVYVILFLRRNGLITIDDIQYTNSKYVFYITVLDRKILSNTSESVVSIDKIRNDEWGKTEYDFYLMKRNLSLAGKCCWSEMFTDIYSNTDDYCAGCNHHIDIIDIEDSRTLRKGISKPLSKCKAQIINDMNNSKCMLFINSNYSNKILQVIQNGLNVLVASDEYIANLKVQGEDNTSLLYCNYSDFSSLISRNKFFISGGVAICIPDDLSMQNRLVNIIENNNSHDDVRYILFSNKDYFITNKGKKLSELQMIQYCSPEFM